jgi:hypothetical protein
MLLLAAVGGAGYLVYRGSRLEATPKLPPDAPRVYLVTDKHDFGTARRGDTVTATFTIRNTHPVAVECGQVMKGCSCAAAEVEPKVIPPGGEAKLTLAWNLTGKRGRAAETVMVPFAGTGVKGLVPAGVTAVVRGPVEVDREVVDLDERNRSAEVVFSSPLGRKFRCVSAHPNHPCVSAGINDTGDRVQLVFNQAVTGWEFGNIYVTVVTDQPDDHEVRIGIRLNKSQPPSSGDSP